jgi:hypothetical protein
LTAKDAKRFTGFAKNKPFFGRTYGGHTIRLSGATQRPERTDFATKELKDPKENKKTEVV